VQLWSGLAMPHWPPEVLQSPAQAVSQTSLAFMCIFRWPGITWHLVSFLSTFRYLFASHLVWVAFEHHVGLQQVPLAWPIARK